MHTATWIWCEQQRLDDYNLAARFRREFTAATAVARAELRITADSRYRVLLNGHWIDDGPGRAYPEHYSYDAHDVTALLRPGRNLLEVVVRHFGIGTYHQIAQQAGLLVELDLDGTVIASDRGWLATPLPALRQWQPKISNQMEPVEWYDARLAEVADWRPAVEICRAGSGPWRDLTPRLPPPLSRTRHRPVAVHGCWTLRRDAPHHCVPVAHLAHPQARECNHSTGRPILLSAELELASAIEIAPPIRDWSLAVDGRRLSAPTTIPAGRHAALLLCTQYLGLGKEIPFPALDLPGATWRGWEAYIRDEHRFRDDDRIWFGFPSERRNQAQDAWLRELDALAASWSDPDASRAPLGRRLDAPAERLCMPDIAADFVARVPTGSATHLVTNPQGICAGGSGNALLRPAPDADVELCFDLGTQRCGYLDVELAAPAGSVIDLHLVEHITPAGVVQHPNGNRNGMRLVAGGGVTRHLSLKRRSGRFVFVTLRDLTGPVELRRIDLIEATAPMAPVGCFSCSDPLLDRIWLISERTLRLCMEDVFTDCPLYEQTLWIGDARNQALYAFQTYGDATVSARSLELGAQSLECFPIVGCQVPSTWECLLPAWSFLWGMHVWEHHVHTGDLALLRRLWPAVQRNLDGAWSLRDRHGLFSGPFWNMLDWAPVDQNQRTVLHNSLLLIGALRAAECCAGALGACDVLPRLRGRRDELAGAIAAWFDPARRGFPDAVREDGTASPQTCQHNAALALLHLDLSAERRAEAARLLTDPPAGMTRMHSPFACQFLFEAMEAAGEQAAILAAIRENYGPMLDAGATTVWETFPGSTCSPAGFPTRSHCHGWSAGPLYFLNRIVLGIRQEGVGGESFVISPWFSGLTHAEGATATPRGAVRVAWRIVTGEATIEVEAPAGVRIAFVANPSHAGLRISTRTTTRSLG